MQRGHKAEDGTLKRLTGLSAMKLRMKTQMRPSKQRSPKKKRPLSALSLSLMEGTKFVLFAGRNLADSLNRFVIKINYIYKTALWLVITVYLLLLFFQSEGNEEEGWYLHNAMVYEGTVYHPECFKDKNNAMDSSLDTSADQTMAEENEVVPKEEPMSQEVDKVVSPAEAENGESMEVTVAEPVSIKEEKDAVQQTDNQENAPVEEMEVKSEEPVEKVEPEEEKAEDKQEDQSANTSLADDNMLLAAPVVTQPKVVVTKWRKDRHWGPSSVLFYCIQKYILGHTPLLLRGIHNMNDSSALMAWLLIVNRPVIIQGS